MRTAFTLLAASLALVVACGADESTGTSKDKATPTFGDDEDAITKGECVKNAKYYDVPGDDCDNDDDGEVDNPPTCDGKAGASSASDFARAMGICATADEDGYGLVEAEFTTGYGSSMRPNEEQHGVLPRFGSKTRPTEGKKLGVLSTGVADEFNGAPGRPFTDSQEWQSGGTLPPGYPKAAAGCEQDDSINDAISVRLKLKAPKNATGFKFDFNFHSSEWPRFICSTFNDGFIAYLTADGFNGGQPDNISFDAKKNPVSVNNGFFDRCTPSSSTGCSAFGGSGAVAACGAGEDELEGTGFGLKDRGCGGETTTQGGATGWLSSQAAVKPGETFTIEFIIWDTGDASLDSTVLLDNFRWIGGEVETTTERTPDVN